MTAVPDDDVESALVDYLIRLPDVDPYDRERVGRLPLGLRTWWVAFIVDAEILNGGFNQLFFNPTSALAPLAPEAFDRLGIPAAATIFREAIDLLSAHAPALQRAAKDGTLEAFAATYTDQPFSRLDGIYTEGEATWREARLRWIRSANILH